MQKTTYKIAKMDCAAEESVVCMKLEGMPNIKALQFDIANRNLDVIHEGNAQPITVAIDNLNFNSTLIKSEDISDEELVPSDTTQQEKKLLKQVFVINFFFFLLECITGIIAASMGLLADSLDMLADSIIYALALFAVGSSVNKKKSVAHLMGYFQLGLTILGFIEVARRFFGHEQIPAFQTMIIISVLALIGNATSLYLLQKAGNKEAHIKASTICTSSDVIVNVGVIVAGVLVYFTSSNLPDLIIGTIAFALVGLGAYRILKL